MHPKAFSIGTLLLRLTIGGLLLLHGISKLKEGVGGIEAMLSEAGWPKFFAYGVIIGEVVAPIFIILGAWTRIAALVVAFNMIVAILMAHSHDIFALDDHGASKIETPLLYLMGAIVIALIGGGHYSVTKGKWS